MNDEATPQQQFDSLDALIEAMYRAVSGPDRGLDIDLERQVFTPDVRLMRCGLDERGKPWRQDMSLSDYEENTREFLANTDFYEIETSKTVVHCPPFAYVLSEYEAKTDPASDELLLSGVNSIQCLHDGERWWICQMMWNHRDGVSPGDSPFLPPQPGREDVDDA